MSAVKQYEDRTWMPVATAIQRLQTAGYYVTPTLSSIQIRAIGVRSKLVIYPDGVDAEIVQKYELKRK